MKTRNKLVSAWNKSYDRRENYIFYPREEVVKLVFIFISVLYAQGLYSQNVDTLASYNSFKLYSGESDSIYVSHPRYYGYFVKDTCTSEDFATRMKSQKACYKRISSNFSPRFLELGRSSPLPILGGPMVKEVDAINGAAYLAHLNGGDTLMIDSFFEIDKPVYLFDNVTYFGTNPTAGFHRANPPVTTLTKEAFPGDDKLIVESVDGFRKSHKINIFSGKGYDELSSASSYNGSVSSFLGGDTTIFLSGLKIQKGMAVGDTVSLLYPMMTPLLGTTNNVRIEGLVFDGNRAANNFSYDWRVATTIVTPSSENLVIENCHFQEIQSENIFLCGATLIDCSGEGFNGSVAHFSCQDGDYITQVLYNSFNTTNEVGDSIMEHSEAALTFSAKVQGLRVAYNNIDEIREKGIGNFANDDYSVEITDNVFNSDKEIVGYVPFYEKDSLNTIYNNKNLNLSSSTTDDCIFKQPTLLMNSTCAGLSNSERPLEIGDSITIVFDSLRVISTNDNFLKCIEPLYSEEFFSLVGLSIRADGISPYHQWVSIWENGLCEGLVFDNGHRNGLFGNGNWGYEGCSKGNCNGLSLTFVVHSLPVSKSEVPCPLTGLNLKYDGEVETWDYDITCQNSVIEFEEGLGHPVLNGTSSFQDALHSNISIYPNPASDRIVLGINENFPINYQITDSFGNEIKKSSLLKNDIDVSDFPSGVYIIRFNYNEEVICKKFIKL